MSPAMVLRPLTLAVVAAVTITATRAQQRAPRAAADPVPQLRHWNIDPNRLPAPFATPSASNSADVVSKPASARLVVPPGFTIRPYATNFSAPREMVLAPNGDVFVSDVGSGQIIVLRDNDRDGVPDDRFTFASGLNEPFGLAFHDGYLYVGNTNAVVRYSYAIGQTRAAGPAQKISDLPGGGHWTRDVAFSPSGAKLYVSIGSSSNVSVESDPLRASIVEMNPDGSARRVFASGLRNPVGLAFHPTTAELWTVVNERDGLGDDLVPDYATRVRDGAFFGWPYSYIGKNPDPRVSPQRSDLVNEAEVPSVLFQSHSAPLGIAFYTGRLFPAEYNGDAFVAMHGSWNRSQLTGYKVVRIHMRNGVPVGGYDDFIVGWAMSPTADEVWGRPTGLVVLGDGSLLVSDDGSGMIWRLTYATPAKRRAVR